MGDDLGQIVEKRSLRIAQKSMRTAKGVLLAHARNRERLARETCQKHVMGRNFLRRVRVGAHVLGKDMFAIGRLGKIGVVGLPAEPVPFGGEHAPPANGLERKAQASDSGKEVDEPETFGPCACAAGVGGLAQLLKA